MACQSEGCFLSHAPFIQQERTMWLKRAEMRRKCVESRIFSMSFTPELDSDFDGYQRKKKKKTGWDILQKTHWVESQAKNASKVTMYRNQHQTRGTSTETSWSKPTLTSHFLLHALLIHAVWARLHASSSRFIWNVHRVKVLSAPSTQFKWPLAYFWIEANTNGLTANSVEYHIHPPLLLPRPFCTRVVKSWQWHRYVCCLSIYCCESDCGNAARLLRRNREWDRSPCHFHIQRYIYMHMCIKSICMHEHIMVCHSVEMAKGGNMLLFARGAFVLGVQTVGFMLPFYPMRNKELPNQIYLRKKKLFHLDKLKFHSLKYGC